MTAGRRVTILTAVTVALVGAFLLRERERAEDASVESSREVAAATRSPKVDASGSAAPESSGGPGAAGTAGTPAAPAALPRLLDLGSDKCVPCKMMAPMLKELQKTHATVFRTEFIDVRENRDEATKYGIRVIPTQIFFDAEGNELFRHEGYFSREAILEKWTELGIAVPAAAAGAAAGDAGGGAPGNPAAEPVPGA